MDLFLAHGLILIWTSLGATRQLFRSTADRLLAAALLAWGNLVVTSLLLSSLHRLGAPLWFFGTSVLLAGLTTLLLQKISAEPAAPAEPAPHPWLVGACLVTLAPLAYTVIRSAVTFASDDADLLAWQLPRVLYYLGQNSLAHFDAADPRQIFLPFNRQLLQLFALVYDAPLPVLNFLNLAAWAFTAVAVYRLVRLAAVGADFALVAAWLVLAATRLLAPGTVLTADLPAAAAALTALGFLLRWKKSRLRRDALLAGLAAGLAAGSEAILFIPLLGLLVLIPLFWRRPAIAPVLLALGLAAPFAVINFATTGRLFAPPHDVVAVSPAGVPEVPVLIRHRLASQPLLNLDSDAADERIFPLLALGTGQRFTSRRPPDPARYNVFSRAHFSRGTTSAGLASTALVIPVPAKRTAGIEFLGTMGRGETARDYFGLEPGAAGHAPIDSNRNLLLTVETPAPAPGGPTRLRLAGLHAADRRRVIVDADYTDWSTGRLATFSTGGVADVSLAKPFRWLTIRVEADEPGIMTDIFELPAVILDDGQLRPVALQRSGAGSLAVSELVVPRHNTGWIAATGQLPVDNPVPQWGLPYIRWAHEPSVRLPIPATPGLTRLRVAFSVRPQSRDLADLDVRLNGQLVQHFSFTRHDAWLDQTVELNLPPGENLVELQDATRETEPDWPAYLELHPDVKAHVAASHVSPEQGAREHYELQGRRENRTVPQRATGRPALPADSRYFIYRFIRLEGFRAP